MRGSDFIFDSVQLLYYKCHKINFRRGGSYTNSRDWIKNNKATINPKNKDDKCFQYAVTVAFNYGETETHSKGSSNIRAFMNKYNWDGIKYPSKIDARKTFEKNNPSIALNPLYIKKIEICPGYISKINLNCEKQIILLMIPNEEKQETLLVVIIAMVCSTLASS